MVVWRRPTDLISKVFYMLWLHDLLLQELFYIAPQFEIPRRGWFEIDFPFCVADPECNNTNDVGVLKCPNVPGASPSLSVASSIETPITTSSTKEIFTRGSMQSSTIITASEPSCIPTVTTKTISSEVTNSVSCADICDKTLFTVTSTETIISTETFTRTVYSTVIPAKTVQASESISTKTVATTEITTKTVVPTVSESTDTLMQFSGSLSIEATPAWHFSSQTVSSAVTSPNKRLSHAVTFAKQCTIPSAALFTDPCDRCFSSFMQSTTSSITEIV